MKIIKNTSGTQAVSSSFAIASSGWRSSKIALESPDQSYTCLFNANIRLMAR